MKRQTAAAVVVALSAALASPVSAGRFRPDDPVLRDRDDLPSARPTKRDLSQYYDTIKHLYFTRPDQPDRSVNVNTLGEVPDSSWFTNRLGRSPMTVAAVVQGPDQTSGPDVSAPLQVLAGKNEGITPGFTMRDGRGETWFVKFDPPGCPHLASGAEIISTKLFHAFGYHVPENHLAYLVRDRLVIAPGATLRDVDGRKRSMTEADLDRLLAGVPHEPDGSIRILASRRLSGQPLGPFEYWGTRPDDANDIYRHEDRRELRGLRVFAAWLNHDDARSINSLDVYLGEEGQGHVKHYLLDFGSTLGSGSVKPQSRRAGNEYLFEARPFLLTALTFGIWERPWHDVRYPDYPELGRLEASFFRPGDWRPEYPNPAFDRLLPEDALWAVAILARVNDEMVRVVVEQARFSDPAAAEHLVTTLGERRRKILAHWLAEVNPLVGFRIEPAPDGEILAFDNLGVSTGQAPAASYEQQWFNYDNDRDHRVPLGPPTTVAATALAIPSTPADFLMVRIRTLAAGQPHWQEPVDVYLRMRPSLELVGIERASREAPAVAESGR